VSTTSAGVVWIPLPDSDFDITEVAVPWRTMRRAGFDVRFATPQGGQQPACDPLLVDGPIFGKLGARPEALACWADLKEDPAFRKPAPYADIDPTSLCGLLLPGGHAPGMRPYLEDTVLQSRVTAVLDRGLPLAAICHGVLVLARASRTDGSVLLAGRSATCLPWWMEMSAWALTAWKLGRYYRTYDSSVQAEVVAALGAGGHFLRGPLHNDYGRPFLVQDGNLLTARWPGDAQHFADTYVAMLQARDFATLGALTRG
jgi:putative intracellular protease/amidase